MLYLMTIIGLSVFLGVVMPTDQKGSTARKAYCVIMFLVLFGFAALRGESVGIDTAHRYVAYEQYANMSVSAWIDSVRTGAISDLSLDGSDELGNSALVLLLSHICEEPWFGEIIYSAFILIVHFWFFYNYCEQLPLTTELFIIFNFSATMNTTRQYMAISFFLIATHFIIKRKPIPALLFVVAAYLFHTSALICLVFCILAFRRIKLTKRAFAILIPVSIVAILTYNKLLDVLLVWFPKYSHYLNMDFYGESSGLSIFWVALYVVILALILHLYPKAVNLPMDVLEPENVLTAQKEQDEKMQIFGVNALMFLAYAVCDTVASFLKAVYRIMRYFYSGFTIMLPDTVMKLFKKNEVNRVVMYFAFLATGLVVGYMEFKANKYDIFPYRFFW